MDNALPAAWMLMQFTLPTHENGNLVVWRALQSVVEVAMVGAARGVYLRPPPVGPDGEAVGDDTRDVPMYVFASTRAKLTAVLASPAAFVPVAAGERMSTGYYTFRWPEDEELAEQLGLDGPDLGALLEGEGYEAEYEYRHPGDDRAVEPECENDGFGETFAPCVTKAGDSVVAVAFGAPPQDGLVEREATLSAAYPLQLLARVDDIRKKLILDCHEYVPSADDGSVPTMREVLLAKRTFGQGMGGGGGYGYEDSDCGSSEDEANYGDLDAPAKPIEDVSEDSLAAMRLQATAAAMAEGRVFRYRVGLDDVCGIKLHATELGAEAGLEEGGAAEAGLEGGGAALVLDLAAPPAASTTPFAVRRCASRRQTDRKWRTVEDWTPGAVASRATRVVVQGCEAEMRELAAHLCAVSPTIASMLSGEGRNSLAEAGTSCALADAPVPVVVAAAPSGSLAERAAAAVVASGGTAADLRVAGYPDLAASNVAAAGAAAAALPPPPAAQTDEARCAAIHERLSELGVDNPAEVNGCLKAAIFNGRVTLNRGLDVVVCEGECNECCGQVEATIRDMLDQPEYVGRHIAAPHPALWRPTYSNVLRLVATSDPPPRYPGNYGEGEGGAATCEDCETSQYVSGLCTGNGRLDHGKFTNHCMLCPNFGTCIFDYREAHCEACGTHWFRGNVGFPCTGCGGSGHGERKGSPPEADAPPASWPGTIAGAAKKWRDGRGPDVAAMIERIETLYPGLIAPGATEAEKRASLGGILELMAGGAGFGLGGGGGGDGDGDGHDVEEGAAPECPQS